VRFDETQGWKDANYVAPVPLFPSALLRMASNCAKP
jgi:hypothetical protein